DGPHSGPGPAGVDHVGEGLEHGHGDDGGDEAVGGLVELEDAGDQPGLVEDRRTLVGRGQEPAAEVDGSRHRQGGDGRPGQRPAPVPGPDEQRQQRPHDQVGDDPPVAVGDPVGGDGRRLPGHGDHDPRRAPHAATPRADPSSAVHRRARPVAPGRVSTAVDAPQAQPVAPPGGGGGADPAAGGGGAVGPDPTSGGGGAVGPDPASGGGAAGPDPASGGGGTPG